MDIRAVKLRVGREWRVGGLYRPEAPGRRTPGCLLLHGFPGVQRNEDLAAELCRRGVTVLAPHFRGCWGSGGDFSVGGLLEDARAALRLLARYRHVDAERVAVLGYSLGGWVALRLAAERRLAAVAALAPAVPGGEPGAADARYLRANGRVLRMPDPGAVWREWVGIARAERPEAWAARIAPTPLLLVHGERDRLVAPAASRAVWALAREPKTLLRLPGEEHEFQNDRAAFVAQVADWLCSRLVAGPAAAAR